MPLIRALDSFLTPSRVLKTAGGVRVLMTRPSPAGKTAHGGPKL